ncbi:exonuclease domain-containing protein [Zhongshania aliphaticivorans]|uniref:exonuclease domain-containing protein n=1 Tax=Zhongshania aliphaticivorans TaxID=1470434 RepID=UPI0012E4FDE8|nr:exonuclease domain-containing protein [Zhongshania aliphaticivorans]CAA0082920.1 Putative bifunctional exonuclease/endonuclease protein [Zhongshania aliphaticivorans]
MLDQYRFALVDLETTGGQPREDQIMEVAIRLEDSRGHTLGQWQSLVDPQCSIPFFIQNLTGISAATVRGQPRFAEVVDTVWGYLEGAILVAHNAKFDAGFLRHHLRCLGYEYEPKVLCTLKLARTLYPDWPKHGLEAICNRIGFYSEVHHRAMADVDAMKAFLDYARGDKGEAVFNFELGLQLGLPVLPPSINQGDIDAIPCQPGVYRLLGEAGELLYLGGAASLQTQVLSHFTNCSGDSKATKLARRVCGVQWHVLAGELSVGFYLSASLRFEKPQMQRRAKAIGKPCCVRFVLNDNGVTQLRFRSGLPASVVHSGECVAIFRDRKQAKMRVVELAEESALCLRLLGILAEGESCGCADCTLVSDVLNENLGVVAQQEVNQKLAEALASYLYTPWPFDEPVFIYEQNASGFGEWHLINAWRYYGSFVWDADTKLMRERIVTGEDTTASINLEGAKRRCEQAKDFQYEHYRLIKAFINDLPCQTVSDFFVV